MAHVDRVASALKNVSKDGYELEPEGSRLMQTTRPDLTYAMLRQLWVQVGDAVLEIGTGSGYSTALLAKLVG